MAFFLPSSTSTSTTTSLSSSPLTGLRQLDSEDESTESHDGNGSLRHRRSDDFPSPQSGFTMFGLLSRRIEYISGASASDISSLESSSESEVESWTRRDEDEDEDEDDEDDDRHRNTRRRTSHSTRDARSPSGRGRSPDNIIQVHDDAGHPVVELLSVGTSRSHGATRTITTTTDHTGSSTTREPNIVASSTNQIEGEETVKRKGNRTRHDSTEVDRSRGRRVILRNRRREHAYEAFICKYDLKKIVVDFGGRFIRPFHAARDFFLVITLCFGLACAWMVLARPIMMNWFGFVGSRSGDEYMYMDG